jgi:cobalamin synthase
VFLLEGTGWNLNGASYLPRVLEWIRPQPWYRALLLAPVWGSWAMLLTVQFHRPDENTEPCVASFARRCGPATAAFTMAATLMVSLWYFNHLSWWQFSIPLVTILSAASAGAWFCRVAGGLRRDPLLAVNLLTQMAFLAAYLVNRR